MNKWFRRLRDEGMRFLVRSGGGRRLYDHATGWPRERAYPVQTASAISADFLLVSRGLFDELGGFDTRHLPHTLFDVDFCLRLRERGLRTVWTPHALLRRRDDGPDRSADTPDGAATRAGRAYLLERWADLFANDPCYHPLLDRRRGDFSLAAR